MSTDMVRWTVSVSHETDIAVRGFLAQHGMKKGDLSRFIEEAVRWRVFDRTMAEARSGVADMELDALEDLIGEAVTATLATTSPAKACVWPPRPIFSSVPCFLKNPC